MRKLLSTLLLSATAATLLAVPAKRGTWKTVQLSDGTKIKVELRGDEYGHFWQSADGTMYVKDMTDGIYKPTDMHELSRKFSARRQAATAIRSKKAAMKARLAGKAPIYSGSKKGLLILVEFNDKKFKEGHDLALYKDIVNGINYSNASLGFRGSVRDYFRDQSDGQFDFDIDVVGPVSLPNNYAYYGANDYSGADVRAEDMIIEACQLVDDEVDFTQYDWNGDGEMEQVFVLYAGHGEASYNDDNTVWPHMWYLWDGARKSLVLDGIRINPYACGSELGSMEYIDGIGTICHEFSHCFGLPDMYDTNGKNYGMISWSLMDYGSYNDDGFTPAEYTSYEKMAVGWKQPIELTEDTEVTDMKPYSDGGDAYILYNKGNRNEYIMLENRQLTGWDAGLWGSGLLAIHVDYDAEIWEQNEVNTLNEYTGNTHQRCTVIPADNNCTETTMGVAGDTYPYRTVTSITSSAKNAALYNKNTDGTYDIGMQITDITQNTDGTVSFNVKKSENSGNTGGDNTDPSEYLFYESFDDCSGKGGNDDLWSGNIANATFTPDNDGWSALSSKSSGANKCAKFGTSSVMGIVTTPTFTINGETTFTFMAAPWDKDDNSQNLEVSGNATISPSNFTMSAHQWTTFTAKINGQGNVSVTFTPGKRMFLDEVKAYVTTTSIKGIETHEPEKSADSHIYSLDGRYVGNDINSLPHGIYILKGKKIIK